VCGDGGAETKRYSCARGTPAYGCRGGWLDGRNVSTSHKNVVICIHNPSIDIRGCSTGRMHTQLGREHDSGELSLKIDDFGKGHGFTLASEKDPTIANPYKRHIQVPKTLLP
jgi:hypothetical protein